MANVADRVFDLILDTVENEGVYLWDVKFLKEGASYYLRVFIDKDDGVSIDDCVAVSHAIDPVLDEHDPIDKSYCLEVCSPGIERELSRDFHFTAANGCPVKLKVFKAIDSKKEFIGTLSDFTDGIISLETENGTLKFERSQVSKASIIYTEV